MKRAFANPGCGKVYLASRGSILGLVLGVNRGAVLQTLRPDRAHVRLELLRI